MGTRLSWVSAHTPSLGPQVRLPARPGRLLCELRHRLGFHRQWHGAAAAAWTHPVHLPNDRGQDRRGPQERQAGAGWWGRAGADGPLSTPHPSSPQPPHSIARHFAKCFSPCGQRHLCGGGGSKTLGDSGMSSQISTLTHWLEERVWSFAL